MGSIPPAKVEVLKAHGSQNDLFIVEGRPDELGLPDLARWLCDRGGPLGGADGVYAVDASTGRAWFANPDGSAASFCGNGMRCVGRLLLDRRQRDEVRVRSGAHEFTIRRAEPTPEGVAQTVVELPPVRFREVDQPAPVLHPTRRFTALDVPNPHVVALVDAYDETELVEVGKRVAASPRAYPDGANVSYVFQLGGGELFMRTYERGAGLTMSCGSGVAAARAVCSRLGLFPPETPVLVRNPGGVTRAWLEVAGDRWCPRIEGNASFVFRATVDPTHRTAGPPDPTGEEARFAALDAANREVLRAHGVSHSMAQR